ncbi:MAG: molybdopterin-synthase adenylyltransferase MoeB [Gemmatimonadetes bacterium]|nr:molybdopterin-synthase adenylyltransferase MoeB [Gemmatimonadota bacterium]NIO32338.1 molybdopterin-synthase adenylyltransferase MoeB [Gemmatimonadota bacterium]
MNRITVIVPSPLRQFTEGRDSVTVDAGTVAQALSELTSRYTELRRHLYSEDGQLRSFVNIYLNDEDIRYLEGKEDAGLTVGDEIRIVPSIAGGVATAVEVKEVEFSPEEMRRYARHLILPEVGPEGQKKLKRARVLLIGAGGLGSPASLYLAAAGVGTIGLVDFDVVESSNLQRQIVHGTSDVGRPKLESARDRLLDVNPGISVEGHEVRLTSQNALDILSGYDIVVDGTDNFPTRYLINDACVLMGIPNVYGSIFRFEGQVSVFYARQGPCYRCLYPEPPPPGLVPSCAEGGVLGVLPGIIGALQANETIKLILGAGDPLVGRLLLFDALRVRFRELKLRKDPECPICGENPTVKELIDYEVFCGIREAEAEGRRLEASVPVITATELKARLDAGDPIRVIDVREPSELNISKLDEAELIPLKEFPASMAQLVQGNEEIVVVCRSGRRSAYAVRLLMDAGFSNVLNLTGGLLAWSDEVDPTMAKY